MDDESDTMWDPYSGQAISGPLRGRRLQALPATPVFAFGWSDYFPESDVYEP